MFAVHLVAYGKACGCALYGTYLMQKCTLNFFKNCNWKKKSYIKQTLNLNYNTDCLKLKNQFLNKTGAIIYVTSKLLGIKQENIKL